MRERERERERDIILIVISDDVMQFLYLILSHTMMIFNTQMEEKGERVYVVTNFSGLYNS